MQTEELSSIIRYHRKKAKLSQSDLADMSGVSRSVIQDIEAGKDRITLKNLLHVLSTLNIQLKAHGPLQAQWESEFKHKEQA